MKCSVVGLGKIGAPLVGVLAQQGHTVVGIDIDLEAVRRIRQAQPGGYETGLESLLAENRERIEVTTDFGAVAATEITFVIVPTPSSPNGGYSLTHVRAAIESIGRVLRGKGSSHIVALMSTVMPGAMESEIQPAFERSAGKRCGAGIGLAYCPEFVAMGRVIRDLREPDMVVIGESDAHTGEILASFFAALCRNSPAIVRTRFINAELAKLMVNAFITMKISFANMLADICERIPGADAHAVTRAAGYDRRIGHLSFRGGMGYGGPCFPRDTLALLHLAESVGASTALARAAEEINRLRLAQVLSAVCAHVAPRGRVAILGLAYKADTDLITESQAVALAAQLADAGFVVTVYDPQAMARAADTLGQRVAFAASAEACVQAGDVVVMATPWAEFIALDPACIARMTPPPTVVDCWHVLDAQRWSSVTKLIQLGTGPEPVPDRNGATN